MFLIKLAITLVTVFLVSCRQDSTKFDHLEKSVYEALFEQVQNGTSKVVYVASSTEYIWFNENPIASTDWDSYREGLNGISMGLVKDLYKVNRKTGPIDWKPKLANVVLLRSKYGRVSAWKSNEELCFGSKGEGNIGIIDLKTSRTYRSYYTVSNVVFTEDSTTALLKLSYHCAPMSGGTELFVVLDFEDNSWEVVTTWRLWIS